MTAGVFEKTPLCEPFSKRCVLVPENAFYVFTEDIKQTYGYVWKGLTNLLPRVLS